VGFFKMHCDRPQARRSAVENGTSGELAQGRRGLSGCGLWGSIMWAKGELSTVGYVVCCPSLGARLKPVFIHCLLSQIEQSISAPLSSPRRRRVRAESRRSRMLLLALAAAGLRAAAAAASPPNVLFVLADDLVRTLSPSRREYPALIDEWGGVRAGLQRRGVPRLGDQDALPRLAQRRGRRATPLLWRELPPRTLPPPCLPLPLRLLGMGMGMGLGLGLGARGAPPLTLRRLRST